MHEPSVGMYFVTEHIRDSVPKLVATQVGFVVLLLARLTDHSSLLLLRLCWVAHWRLAESVVDVS